MHPIRTLGLLAALLPPQSSALKVACNEAWIEHTPFAYAHKNKIYKGDASIVSGGVASLSGNVELGGNAETQGLKQYASHKNYRLIYVIVEATYRLVANKAAGIKTLADLKGKKVGTFQGSSAQVFVDTLIASAGVDRSQFTTVSGNMCMRAPCAANTLPMRLKSREIDAFGCWETAVELGIEAAGEQNVVVFKNATIYREIYSLYATAENLRNPTMRKQIVQYVKALNQTLEVFKEKPEEVYPFVAKEIGVDVPVLRKVWPEHKWGPGDMGEDLIDFLEREEAYLSKVDKRKAATRAELKNFVDTSVYEDAMKL
ncbi:putative aliphatic sulfonates-binding protein [Podospora aff. communis PSN243]|uniref:Aliphatic sulfonates-binding protein n=1 Tax=Podospora aff. communis PSN243 TaxID=3040156 RepID=A0AAV9GQD6_9PEZI|nr:putative aliphatic sulfonates-binding protein [Podospora aff. communis PSN243]